MQTSRIAKISPIVVKMSTKKYRVSKLKVVKGSQFLEDWYKPFSEDIVGIWAKYGHGYNHENPAVKKLKCDSCLQASQQYKEKEEILDIN